MIELNGIPLKVFSSGRSLGDVLDAFMKVMDSVDKIAASPGKDDAEVFADALKVSVYRIYLLGVEDGMEGKIK